MNLLAKLAPTLARQHGLITFAQAHDLEADPLQLQRAVRRGDLRLASTRVLALCGAPLTVEQHVLAAALDAGTDAHVASTTALAIWGIPGFAAEPVHVAGPRSIRGLRDPLADVLHTSTKVPAHHVTTFRGIPIATPTRALFEASASIHPLRLERAIDNCWSRGLTSGPRLHAMFDELRARGRRRLAVMRPLLDERGPDYVPPESGLEARFHQICREAGLPRMRRQVDSGDDGDWLGRVDFRDEVVPLIVQLNSDLYHASLLDRRADERQTRLFERAGYVVLALWQHEVWHERPKVVRDLHEGRRRAARLVRAAA